MQQKATEVTDVNRVSLQYISNSSELFVDVNATSGDRASSPSP
jgi:hypothetical protein